MACHENHSFRHEPQKVCRQSSSVKGWYMTSVHICRCGSASSPEFQAGEPRHTEHVNSFSSTTLPLLLVLSAMMACASSSPLSREEVVCASLQAVRVRARSWRCDWTGTEALVARPCSEASTVSCHPSTPLLVLFWSLGCGHSCCDDFKPKHERGRR